MCFIHSIAHLNRVSQSDGDRVKEKDALQNLFGVKSEIILLMITIKIYNHDDVKLKPTPPLVHFNHFIESY